MAMRSQSDHGVGSQDPAKDPDGALGEERWAGDGLTAVLSIRRSPAQLEILKVRLLLRG